MIFHQLIAPGWENNGYGSKFETSTSESLYLYDNMINDKSFSLEIDLPGCKKEDTQVSYEETGYFNITTKDRFGTSLTRTRYVGQNVDTGTIKAEMRDGVLYVSGQKKNKHKAIEIK